jgi:hypothetical protein
MPRKIILTTYRRGRTQTLTLIVVASLPLLVPAAIPAQGMTVKTEHFDRDPGWEGFNNHIIPKHVPTVTQDFGYRQSGVGGSGKAAIGGRVTRASRPAYYANKIAVKSLNEKLSASGAFKLTHTSGGSGILFGWFNGKQPGGSGRPVNSLGMDFDGEGSGARLAVRMIGSGNKSCGTFITPFIPGKYRPTPIRNDGTSYHWSLSYDPDANTGKGRFSFTIKSDSEKPEAFEGKTFLVDLPEGFKEDGATFDHFGLMNLMKSGGTISIFFSDLEHDGEAVDLSKDPGWEGSGNTATYPDENAVGAHDFGFSQNSNFAGGSPGEVGGKLWRSGDFGYYADRIGSVNLAQPLQASGKVMLLVGAPDSDMFIGWFNSSGKDKSPAEAGDFLAIHVGGPTRVGHYFQPVLSAKKGPGAKAKAGPVLVPERVYEWSLRYDPAANGGKGGVRVTLGNESVTLDLKPGDKREDVVFDRFGLFTSNIGGQMVKIYLDDLNYTVATGKRQAK